VSRGRNWDRQRLRSQVQRFGAESITGATSLQQLVLPLGVPPRRRHAMSRSELRALGEAAVRAWRSRPR
jgi:hypothetical protein